MIPIASSRALCYTEGSETMKTQFTRSQIALGVLILLILLIVIGRFFAPG